MGPYISMFLVLITAAVFASEHAPDAPGDTPEPPAPTYDAQFQKLATKSDIVKGSNLTSKSDMEDINLEKGFAKRQIDVRDRSIQNAKEDKAAYLKDAATENDPRLKGRLLAKAKRSDREIADLEEVRASFQRCHDVLCEIEKLKADYDRKMKK